MKENEELETIARELRTRSLEQTFVSIHHFASETFRTPPLPLSRFVGYCEKRDIHEFGENGQTLRRARAFLHAIREGKERDDALGWAWRICPLVSRNPDAGKPESESDPTRHHLADGLNDLEPVPAGNETPDRALSISHKVIRVPKVREFVISQSGGKCEYCGAEGFPTPNGKRYLEAHHIIALASEGPDTVHNVIALCPGHHREAHYGAKAEALEREFIKIARSRSTAS